MSKKIKTVALDVDGTLLEFGTSFIDRCKEKEIEVKIGKIWNFFDMDIRSYDIFKNLDSSFWLNLKALDKAKDLNVVPSAYISHRNFPERITKKSLLNAGFPKAPVIHVANTEDKIKVIKQLGIEVFVDDRASTVLFCLENGIEAYLLDQVWNADYKCLPRIYTLGELDKICQI